MSNDPAILAQLKRLEFLVGKWTGTGWFQFGDQTFMFDQTENVYYKLDGAILVLEGQGKTNGQVVHNAYGVYSFDVARACFQFDTFEASGRRTQSSAMIEGTTLIWSFKDEQKGVSIRFTARFENDDKWTEVGERSTDGRTWQKFFEMNLRKEA